MIGIGLAGSVVSRHEILLFIASYLESSVLVVSRCGCLSLASSTACFVCNVPMRSEKDWAGLGEPSERYENPFVAQIYLRAQF